MAGSASPVTKSIHVGESGRSLHERTQEHWNDFNSKKQDSHILKHWIIHHGGEGIPNFQIRVIKYCRDALSRQVGEAVRISYREQTLNSKSGYNRSGLSRLVVEEREEESRDIPEENDKESENLTFKKSSEGWKKSPAPHSGTGRKQRESIQVVPAPIQIIRAKQKTVKELFRAKELPTMIEEET